MAQNFYDYSLLLLFLFIFKVTSAENFFGHDAKPFFELVGQHPTCGKALQQLGKPCFIDRVANVKAKVIIDRMENEKTWIRPDEPETCCVKREWLACVKLHLDHPDCDQMQLEANRELTQLENKYNNESNVCSPAQLNCLNGMPQLNKTQMCSQKKKTVLEKCPNAFNELPFKVYIQITEGNNLTSAETCCAAWDMFDCRNQFINEPSCQGQRD